MRRWLFGIGVAALTVALVWVAPALAKPKPPKPPPPRNTTSTVAPTTTTVAPTTTTTVAPTTTTLAGVFLEGTAPVTDQGLIIYGPDFDGLPIPGGEPPFVRLCPAGTALDFAASSFTLTAGLHVEYLAEYGTVIVLADLDVTGTVGYRLVCD